MSATRQQPLFSRPSIATKVVAMLVVLALGGLAAFAVFAPPTRVPQLSGSGGTQVTRTITVPAHGGEPEGGDGGQRGG